MVAAAGLAGEALVLEARRQRPVARRVVPAREQRLVRVPRLAPGRVLLLVRVLPRLVEPVLLLPALRQVQARVVLVPAVPAAVEPAIGSRR